MNKVKLYGDLSSPPTRSVAITCKMIGLPYEFELVDALNKTEEFKKLTPEKEFPVLVDDGFALSESRAIMQYLVDKYAKDDSLYPKDIKARALVNARLDFENGTLSPKISETFMPLFTGEEITQEAIKKLGETVAIVEEFLTREKWVAGPNMTIADISFGCLITILEGPDIDFDISLFPKTKAWMEECRKNVIFKKMDAEGMQIMNERWIELQEKGIIPKRGSKVK